MLYDVFLAYHPADLPAVEALARHLQRERLEPWLDYWRMRGGDPIQETIEHALKNCACCAVFFGPNGTGEWQTEQLRVAIARRVEEGSSFRVIPVLLPGASRGPRSSLPDFLVNTAWVEFGGFCRPPMRIKLHFVAEGKLFWHHEVTTHP